MAEYNFYMAQQNEDGSFNDDVNLEESFPGLRIARISGLNNKGKQRIYTETYVELDELQVYIPDHITRESTDIEFEIVFIGDEGRESYESFSDFVTGHILRYYDDCRKRMATMFLSDIISVSGEMLYGGKTYFIVKFKFKTLRGYTEGVK